MYICTQRVMTTLMIVNWTLIYYYWSRLLTKDYVSTFGPTMECIELGKSVCSDEGVSMNFFVNKIMAQNNKVLCIKMPN